MINYWMMIMGQFGEEKTAVRNRSLNRSNEEKMGHVTHSRGRRVCFPIWRFSVHNFTTPCDIHAHTHTQRIDWLIDDCGCIALCDRALWSLAVPDVAKVTSRKVRSIKDRSPPEVSAESDPFPSRFNRLHAPKFCCCKQCWIVSNCCISSPPNCVDLVVIFFVKHG